MKPPPFWIDTADLAIVRAALRHYAEWSLNTAKETGHIEPLEAAGRAAVLAYAFEEGSERLFVDAMIKATEPG
jgi:predicted metal-dependent HD superfamily phosphohydrolase